MEHFEVLIKYSDYRRIPLFIEAVADWYVENLADDYKEYLTEHPNIEDYWDTLCLHIRNEFLYPQKYLIEQEIKRMKECGKDYSKLLIDIYFAEELFDNADGYSEKIFNNIIFKVENQ